MIFLSVRDVHPEASAANEAVKTAEPKQISEADMVQRLGAAI